MAYYTPYTYLYGVRNTSPKMDDTCNPGINRILLAGQTEALKRLIVAMFQQRILSGVFSSESCLVSRAARLEVIIAEWARLCVLSASKSVFLILFHFRCHVCMLQIFTRYLQSIQSKPEAHPPFIGGGAPVSTISSFSAKTGGVPPLTSQTRAAACIFWLDWLV